MTPTPEGAMTALEALALLRGMRVFLTSRERIKQPEGSDLFDECIAALAAMQQPVSGVSELADWLDSTCTVAEITGGPNIRRDEANRKQAAALLRDHAAQLAAKDDVIETWQSQWAQSMLDWDEQRQRADAAMGLLADIRTDMQETVDNPLDFSFGAWMDAIDALAGGAAEVSDG